MGATYGPVQFTGNLEGWAIDNSGDGAFPADSSAGHSRSAECNGPGCAEIYADFDGTDGQLISFSSTFGAPLDFTGRTLTVSVQRGYGDGGGRVGVFAQSGAGMTGLVEDWTNFDQLDAGFLTLELPLSGDGFDPSDVRRVGVRFDSGTGSDPTAGTAIFLVDDVLVQ
jgi:hypothetical protein